ncbi:hypothetical protein H4J63_05035 [Pseudoalteromonas sp. 5Ae-yellow]|uniref:hypothetical protein n=1 Tax=Pseudoalteromonas sp. 5Ae-yellow TaxID=2759847 RepID=UPI0015F49317|nr:hypothetical protein [Pseudoalteromonas sp. 5Ae-yellow]MBA6408719.1 hypothetical protein [Pseudoalteromonas sp. 5Ae-yellow]
MATGREKRLKEKKIRTSKISDLVRYVSFGLVALTYSIFTSKADFAVLLLQNSKNLFLWASLLGALAILFDYFQYLSGYIAVNKSLAMTGDNIDYNKKWISKRLIKPLFIFKQILAFSGIVLICIAMYCATVA